MADPAVEKPIVSLLAEDPEGRLRVEAFVLGLSETVDGLQDLEQAADFVRVAELARALVRDADAHGFPPLASASEAVLAAAAFQDAKQTRNTILELTEIARRIRLGHRGAAPPGP